MKHWAGEKGGGREVRVGVGVREGEGEYEEEESSGAKEMEDKKEDTGPVMTGIGKRTVELGRRKQKER